MKKIVLAPLLLLAGCLLAGLYGVVHDQISYTVSPDYFHAFKFYQFQISEPLRNRLGAAVVGWYATWWMGAIIGLPLLSVGLALPDARTYALKSLQAFAVAAATALLFGLGALLYATWSIGPESLPPFWFPDEPVDKVAFARVGTMHNFSYLGGFVGIFVAIGYLALARWRLRQA